MNFLKLFKKPEVKPLPEYPKIAVNEITYVSTLLFYGGNKLTELAGNRLYGHPYRPPAFHAAFYIDEGIFLDVGKFKTLTEVEKEFRTTRRIDVIIYKHITPEMHKRLCKEALFDTSKPKIGITLPDYSWTDYLRFGLKLFKPSKKDFCSENVVELFAKELVEVSAKRAVDTAPWDLLEFAEAHPELCEIRTLWVGSDFKA